MKEKKNNNLLHGKGSLRGAIHSSWYLSAMSTYSRYPFKCSAARINTASTFCFEARQAEETSTWEVCFVWVNGDVALKKQCPFSAERAQPFLPSQGTQTSTDAAVELVCSKCRLDFFGVCIIQVIQVILTFNIWQNSYKAKPSSCKLKFVTCICSNDSACWSMAAVIKKHKNR